jgi:putative inorganic carbon (hco3(-)) transporter
VNSLRSYYSKWKNSLKINELWLWIICIALIAVNNVLIINDIYWVALIPLILGLIYLAFANPNSVFFFITFLIPFTIKYDFVDYGFSLSVPAEPLIVILALLWYFKLGITAKLDKRILTSPISVIIIINLCWVFITSISSTIPIVSFKFFLARVCYFTVFYIIAMTIFSDFKKVRMFLWIYGFSLVCIVCYTFIRHSMHFFTQEFAVRAPTPFFYDHTIYGAVISLVLPIFIIFTLKSASMELNSSQKFFSFIFSIILIIGLLFSYSRAAWLSVGVALGFLVLLFFRIRFQYIIVLILLSAVLIYFNWTNIITPMKYKEKEVSSSKFENHMKSMSNITTDVSNTERLNRWSCALRMFEQKPFLGWGPGTYMFQYAPFQLFKDRTIISTNRGNLGNAHSEYLGPLAESGIIGLLTIVTLALVVIYTGMNIYFNHPDIKVRLLTLGIILGLISYFAHGFLNNFLEIDKVEVLFWAYLSVLTAFNMDLNQHLTNKEK